MLKVKVVVGATALDIKAESIAGAVAARSDMTLIAGRVLTVQELDALVDSGSLAGPCCIVLVGPEPATQAPAARYLAECADYVVLRVSAPLGDTVQVAACQVGLEGMLQAVGALVQSNGLKCSRPGSCPPATTASSRWRQATWSVCTAAAFP